ncbi:protein mesh-like isoform X2 [Acropora palmata]|uniref:protein mesh-like isoform X2 n=1 Tax=Acropora palmata TaxID=6131 RepID=UPI003DA07BA5
MSKCILHGNPVYLRFLASTRLKTLSLLKPSVIWLLQVNTNGVVSFLVAVRQFTPHPFPLGDGRRLISPFWGDVDTTNGGSVSYRESTDTLLLQKATADVQRAFIDQHKFTATWIFIATWERVAFYGATRSSQQRKVNTFQAVLVTNGRHSFAIFNYNKIMWTTGTASGGNSDGLGGTPAQGGFNAGDGVRFYVIEGSRTNDILNLPSTSNVARPGQWIFRTDEAGVEAGGCNTKGSLTISPRSGIMLGGTNVKMSGPCFKQNDNIVVQFDGSVNINATFGSELQTTVTVPVLNKTGRLAVKLSIDGGNSFEHNGVFTSVAINRYKPGVQRVNSDSWEVNSSVDISWDSGSIGDLNDQVSIELVRYQKGEDDVVLHSFRKAAETSNTGRSQFVITTGQEDGEIEDRSINLVRVSRKETASNFSQSQWVWSDLFAWNNAPLARERCRKWYMNEPNPGKFKADPSLQPCPRILTQAVADRGRFMSDEECNPSNQDGCSRYHPGAVHCFKMVIPSNMGADQQCCYNSFGNLMLGKPNAGSLNRVHPNAGVPVISNFFHDKVPYQDCCKLTNNCEKYFDRRPSDDGSSYQAPRPATGFGDPHMVTLDGTPFTFNGRGEYFILKVSGVDFTLQGRMEPLTAEDGSLTRATVYTAFAAKESGSDTVQIQLNGRGLVDVLLNGDMVEFDELSLLEFDGVSVLQYGNTSKYSIIFNSGVSVTVEGQQELLGLVTLVPTAFKGNTSGLLGYWDDSMVSEFLRPDGSFLKTNSSLKEIHRNFGQLWVTTSHESLFVYQQGKSHATYHDPSYQPIFADEHKLEFSDKELEKGAQDTCGDNKQCMFDIFTTGKLRIGRATKETVTQFVAVVNDTAKPACVPLNSELEGGVVLRNDATRGISYRFICNRGFVINGSSHVSCEDGVYNGSSPNCLPKECPLLQYGSFANGLVEGSGHVYRSTHRFICNDGYVLVGNSIITCTESGVWNGTKPHCLRECPSLPASIPNGFVVGSGNFEGSSYNFFCKGGYSLVGSVTTFCTSEGTWNASVPICLRECPALRSSLLNGFVIGSGSVEGSVYHFRCWKGYFLVGAKVLYCSGQGRWNGSLPNCFIECSKLASSVPNGRVKGTGWIRGSLHRFSCNAGYTLQGDEALMCKQDGRWNGTTPRCLKDCHVLPSSIPNGIGSGNGSVEGSFHYFHCKKGHSLVGSGTLQCNDKGKWNGSVPTCQIECPQLPLAIEHGLVHGSGHIEGDIIRFTCHESYSLVGQDTLYCNETGTWNGSVPICLKDCPVLPSSIPNGIGSGNGSIEGSFHYFHCKKGHSLVGSGTLQCNDKGKWNGSVPTCQIECPQLPLAIEHGLVHGSGHIEGDIIRFTCHESYSLVGQDTLYCNETGTWNGSVPICLKDCPVLPSSIPNGIGSGNGSIEGSFHYFHCKKGHSLVGSGTLQCNDKGKWNGSVPTCQIECPQLPLAIEHGLIHGSGHIEGDIYRFTCHESYSLVGQDTLYCKETGTWNGSVPICLKDCPVLPSSIQNGFVTCAGSVDGFLCHFSCGKGYSLVGESTLYCSSLGRWNGSVPVCQKDCQELNKTLENGHVNGSGLSPGSTYTFHCHEGHTVQGESVISCNVRGQWNGSVPICSRALADYMETREVWEVAGPVVGSLVFILIVLGGVILLWRRRKSRTKRQDELAEEKIEMNSNSLSPERTTVTYSLVPKSQKETPTVV